MNHSKPDFIIVGAMKGGTSTLAYFLSEQDEIVMAPGEVNYFDNDKNYSKGESWYLKQFRSKEYHKFFGEKTATYHFDEKVPERIYKYNPNVKLIWILRNPIYRAYSNYWHRVKYGLEYNTFKEAIMKEMNGTQRDKWGLYLKRSSYIDQIKAYNMYFGYDQMHIIIFEELIMDMKGNLKELLGFIGIDNNNPKIPSKRTKNVTYLPSSPKTLKHSRKIFGNKIPFKVLRKLFEKKMPGYPKIAPDTEDMLTLYFRDSIDELQKITSSDLTVWKK